MAFPTCVSLCVATEGPLRGPMTPIFSPVSVSGSSTLFRYYTLHVVVIWPSFVSVATPRPAVAQRRGRALHGTAVIDGLREKERDHQEGREREGEMQGEVFPLTFELVFSVGYEVRDTVYLCICVQVFEWVMFLELYASPPPTFLPHPIPTHTH